MTEIPPPARPARPSQTRSVQYKGGDLDAERGPGLGCFWLQVAILVVLVVATPITVSMGFPSEVSAVLLFATIALLLLTGQTVIFLLRLVAADRRSRRRPLASATRTVGELEDAVQPSDTPRTTEAGALTDTPRTAETGALSDAPGPTGVGEAADAAGATDAPASDGAGDVRQ